MGLLRRSGLCVLTAVLCASCQDGAPTTGSLLVQVTGLPAGAVGEITIEGPNSYSRSVSETTTIEGLPSGDYVVTMDTVRFSNSLFAGPKYVDTVSVGGGRTASVDATYAVASGRLDIAVTGLPIGATGRVTVNGPLGFNRVVSLSATLFELRPGTYLIIPDSVMSSAGDRFAGGGTVPVVVPASMAPVSATVNYTPASGTLVLDVPGLTNPLGIELRVTGPDGFAAGTAGTVALHGLRPGAYSVSAPNIPADCPNVFTASGTPTPLVVNRDVVIGLEDSVHINYTAMQAPPEWLNFRIDQVQLVQAAQNYAGTTPMLAGRPALLRVYALANQCNTAQPGVRVTLSTGTVVTLGAPTMSVPLKADPETLLSTWNVEIPGSAMQPGLTVMAEVDPANTVAELNESDNHFPASGAMAVNVVTPPVVGVRIVPIVQSGLTGRIPNVDDLVALTRKLHPITLDVDVREPYTTTVVLQAGGTGWVTLLTDLDLVRRNEPVATQRHYYGVAQLGYTAGTVGIGFVPGKTALGWDDGESGPETIAHELGHNFSRPHSPWCGLSNFPQPSNPDPAYPYTNGVDGSIGYDPADGTLKSAQQFDVMGYCRPRWVSDYTYNKVLQRLLAAPASLPLVVPGPRRRALMVWGHYANGELVLEPTFEVDAAIDVPALGGSYRLSAVDSSGSEIFTTSFEPQRIADAGDAEAFVFALPVSMLRGRTLGALRLSARGRTVTNVALADTTADPGLSVARAGRSVRVRWDATRFPVMLVRDPANGHVLSVARGGDVSVLTDRDDLAFDISNRVHSTRRTVRARQ